MKYDVLPFVVDERSALDARAPKIHGKDNHVQEPQKYERGDVQKGFEAADVVLESEYRKPRVKFTPPWNCTVARLVGTATY